MAKAQADSPFKRFRQLARKLVAAPKAEVQDRGMTRADQDRGGSVKGQYALAGERDIEGRDRDLAADVRDREAEQRDREAEARDDAAGDLDRTAGDRAASERQHAAGEGARAPSGHAEAADNRAHAIIDRKVAAEDRAQAAKDREDSGTDELTAVRRREAGLAARDRDVAAGLRDREAEARDDAAGDLDRTAGDRAASDRQYAADEGAQAASGRAEAADYRAQAINDRKLAAEDRARAAKDREDSGTDELTGASRRGAGLAAIGREINRAERLSGELVAAYVDVDGLKTTNDATGHAAGDTLLIAVADSLRACLRSYDVITRVGGDEFVCVLPGIAVEHARRRFEAVSALLAAIRPGASITVGFARLQTGDSTDDLIQRADDDGSRARRRG